MNFSLARAMQPAHGHGHAHFWQRAALTRRQFLQAGAATTALALFGSELATPGSALAAAPTGGPHKVKAIKGGTIIPFGLHHFYFPTLGNPAGSTTVIENGMGDPSTIGNFKGSVGVAELQGAGKNQDGVKQYWAADVRFMDGDYIDLDGHLRHGTFSFI